MKCNLRPYMEFGGFFIMKSGIYKITSPTGRVYIGQSTDIKERFSSYRRLESKSQTKLHRSFIKHGVQNHIFEIIEFCSEEILNKRERYWQENFNVVEEGLNCRYTKTDDKSGKLSKETINKMSKMRKGIFLGSKNPNFGKTGLNSVCSKQVIDRVTGKIYDSAKDAAIAFDMKYSTLRAQLNGRYKNSTMLKYVKKV